MMEAVIGGRRIDITEEYSQGGLDYQTWNAEGPKTLDYLQITLLCRNVRNPLNIRNVGAIKDKDQREFSRR